MKKTTKIVKEEGQQTAKKTPLTNSIDLWSSQLAARQNLLDGLNEFSDALTARDDSFHCDRRTVWGERVSIQLVRKTTSGQT